MDLLLTTETAAQLLGVAPQTLNDWRVDEVGPAYIKVGRLVKYRLSDLEAWLESRTVRSA
jgi:excisionase family DNA binding protein